MEKKQVSGTKRLYFLVSTENKTIDQLFPTIKGRIYTKTITNKTINHAWNFLILNLGTYIYKRACQTF